ncbi:Maf family nucleotide pyrophosphatase [Arthrospiribacter ruber]|uniref:dTTP/UTP pyrophosphatase n=1 Tax=Arthrospiribacter ruber TaxID=2487934 RepID=A0A951MBW9_9BACT|nr:Maf family nucleotide pyrophosphatase [Arthrospiribacter ruber]MBW3466555.1 septum formation protein Maf [Arthrospiribacter ruber]
MIDLKDKKLILASKSPRRSELLKGLELDFEIRTKEVEEDFPEDLEAIDVAAYLSRKKAMAFHEEIGENEILLTSDTVVLSEGKVLGKPNDQEEARLMLKSLSGKTHHVISAITLKSRNKEITRSDVVTVHFKDLREEEIIHYVQHYTPMDKAGSYGIQEWIGYIGVKSIEGSFFSVMGLPVHLVYEELQAWEEEG